MDKTSVNLQLEIRGDDFDLQLITTCFNLSPTEQWKKGDPVEKSIIENEYISVDYDAPLTRKDTVWSVETGYERTYDISDLVPRLLNIVGGKASELYNIQNEANVEILIGFIVLVYDDIKPALVIDRDLIAFAHKINASIDIDMYFY